MVERNLDEVRLPHHLPKLGWLEVSLVEDGRGVGHHGAGRVGVHQVVRRLGVHQVVRRLGVHQLVRRLGVHQVVRRHRRNPDRSRSWEDPGLAIPPGSVPLLLQLAETGSLELGEARVPGGAVTQGVGVVSSGSTLNKTKENYSKEI